MNPSSHGNASALRLLLTGAALLLLAAASFSASFMHWGRLALPLALSFSVVKASLVLSIFMGLSRERASIKLAGLSALLLVGLLVGFVAADVSTREEPLLTPGTVR
jgi:caa(3)-type oxidase subunit IV